jgi:hypothetical protein
MDGWMEKQIYEHILILVLPMHAQALTTYYKSEWMNGWQAGRLMDGWMAK